MTRFLAGLQAGMMAVIVMLGWLGVSAIWQRHTFWSAPNQMATVFRGAAAIAPGFGPYTATGIAVYVLVYSLIGAIFALTMPRTPLRDSFERREMIMEQARNGDVRS